ncbi:hypothetical protein ADUPG1_006581 [Aduncisulcus paluster]|uniref:RING-type domain-containing protein n=1 Tax=Aduncisulcus paluster TaxID=2918883 RepID=A0ABQ5KM74_9EUKA|nr:hypothetical protein ADUPG1_006581 [Aduncisulcus paluster]
MAHELDDHDYLIDMAFCGSLQENNLFRCDICGKLLASKDCFKLKCGHTFHIDCIKKRKTSKLNCPSCSAPLPVSTSIRGFGGLTTKEINYLEVVSFYQNRIDPVLGFTRPLQFRIAPKQSFVLKSLGSSRTDLMWDSAHKSLILGNIMTSPSKILHFPPFLPNLSSSSLKYPLGGRLSDYLKNLKLLKSPHSIDRRSAATIALVLLRAHEIASNNGIDLREFSPDDVFLSINAMNSLVLLGTFMPSLIRTISQGKDQEHIFILPPVSTKDSRSSDYLGIHSSSLPSAPSIPSVDSMTPSAPSLGCSESSLAKVASHEALVESDSLAKMSMVRLDVEDVVSPGAATSSHCTGSGIRFKLDFNPGIFSIPRLLGYSIDDCYKYDSASTRSDIETLRLGLVGLIPYHFEMDYFKRKKGVILYPNSRKPTVTPVVETTIAKPIIIAANNTTVCSSAPMAGVVPKKSIHYAGPLKFSAPFNNDFVDAEKSTSYPSSLVAWCRYVVRYGNPPISLKSSIKQLFAALMIYLPFALFMLTMMIYVYNDVHKNNEIYVGSIYWENGGKLPFLTNLIIDYRYVWYGIGAACGIAMMALSCCRFYGKLLKTPVKDWDESKVTRIMILECFLWIVGMVCGCVGNTGCALFNSYHCGWMTHMFLGPIRIVIQIILNLIFLFVQWFFFTFFSEDNVEFAALFSASIHIAMSYVVYSLFNRRFLTTFSFWRVDEELFDTYSEYNEFEDEYACRSHFLFSVARFLVMWTAPLLESLGMAGGILGKSDVPNFLLFSSIVRRCGPWFLCVHYFIIDFFSFTWVAWIIIFAIGGAIASSFD